MEGFVCKFKVVIFLLVLVATLIHARHVINPPRDNRKALMQERADPMQIAGSSLPDCTHACGSCTPCRLVIVSFVCSSLEEAETCPIAYKCMCHNKSYPVP
ncbi:hypothetical protein ACJIZ3_007409 [Penstemon smallii]|uniref:Epidermal patterning factor-like protein n=1 Tax=Penstemon smallii TaxID=265156 RepID=A0ABD3SAI2_9LAMI